MRDIEGMSHGVEVKLRMSEEEKAKISLKLLKEREVFRHQAQQMQRDMEISQELANSLKHELQSCKQTLIKKESEWKTTLHNLKRCVSRGNIN